MLAPLPCILVGCANFNSFLQNPTSSSSVQPSINSELTNLCIALNCLKLFHSLNPSIVLGVLKKIVIPKALKTNWPMLLLQDLLSCGSVSMNRFLFHLSPAGSQSCCKCHNGLTPVEETKQVIPSPLVYVHLLFH